MTTIPETHRVFRRGTTPGTTESPMRIELTTEPTLPPEGLGPHDVLIRVRAVSLNYRDVAMLRGLYPFPVAARGIPASDCAAEVAAVGTAVTHFLVGDRVSPIFALSNITGNEQDSAPVSTSLGGEAQGVLREHAVFEDKVLVHLPEYLTWEETSTITCAGVTAWNALNAPGSFNKKKIALLQGTGGVSMFALLLALAGGITPVISSSSDQKLDAIKKLGPPGAVLGYNYRTKPDQAAAVKALVPGGRGVDIVVNNVGPLSIPADIETLTARNGTISLVGFLGGLTADWSPDQILHLIGKCASIQGIAVGSKLDNQALNTFLEENQIRLEPLIDRVFSFEESEEAFDYLWSGQHMGKVVIKF
ncbi:alcohol dehydrogenase [Podospora didyma]|uniref:Alcohol dehydrogenase n=1 Tax=Podospora didyma TaxID=330526 RepID=A0AAE0K3E1_9PEZI|nr:alcohol dehydrogenase [Podospora didyma]